MAIPARSLSVPTPVLSISPTTSKLTNEGSKITERVYSLLVNRADMFLTAKRGRWYTQHLTLTPPLIEAALEGTLPLGIAAVSGTGTARWICLDADRPDQLPLLLDLARQMAPLDCTLFEFSRRGGHLWIFHQSTHWHNAHRFGSELAQEAGLEGIEVYPRHGNPHTVKLPGTLHPKSGLVYPIVDPSTGEVLSLEAALGRIQRLEVPQSEMVQTPAPVKPSKPGEFEALVEALSALTTLKVYREDRASGLCPFHADHAPSLYIKGGRFRCLSSRCHVWGDIHDIERFIRYGTPPPH